MGNPVWFRIVLGTIDIANHSNVYTVFVFNIFIQFIKFGPNPKMSKDFFISSFDMESNALE